MRGVVGQTAPFGKAEVLMSQPATKSTGSPGEFRYLPGMSFNEMLAELPGMTFGQRQMLIRCALELDDRALDDEDEILVEERLSAHRAAPGDAVDSDEMKARLRARSF